ncbi:MAG: hypothetical protein ACK4IX_12230 [Candidatus Sericytochromatia bacterium]
MNNIDSNEKNKKFEFNENLIFNVGNILNPSEFAKENKAASWLYLNGEEFAKMEGGISYEQVQQAIDTSVNIISDPPRELNLELARQHVSALDKLPRPTLVTCRKGPRSSAVSYMYSGLRSGADPKDVIATAEENNAPFCSFQEYKDWVVNCIETLRKEGV